VRGRASRSGLALAAIVSLLPIAARSQAFEVASIKPNHSGSGSSGDNTAHGRLTVTNDSLKDLMQLAFGVKDFQIEGGPGWIATERYDIVATTGKAGDLTEAELRPMLQALLADRFALKFHRETKQITVYSLVVAKNGPKLTEHMGGGDNSNSNTSGGAEKRTMTVTNGNMTRLARNLERQVGRIVTDNTGLTGAYDYKLEWAPDQSPDTSLPSLFTALQEQLGLRLDSGKGPAEIIVIDSVEKASEN
jgi:uncharacterized protein (TIGR03435 family)